MGYLVKHDFGDVDFGGSVDIHAYQRTPYRVVSHLYHVWSDTLWLAHADEVYRSREYIDQDKDVVLAICARSLDTRQKARGVFSAPGRAARARATGARRWLARLLHPGRLPAAVLHASLPRSTSRVVRSAPGRDVSSRRQSGPTGKGAGMRRGGVSGAHGTLPARPLPGPGTHARLRAHATRTRPGPRRPRGPSASHEVPMSSTTRSLTLADAPCPARASCRTSLLVVAASLVTAAAAQLEIRLPWTPVPVTGQTFAVLLTGVVLGARRAFLAQTLYLLEGACGLPVFSGGAAGALVLAGPTGGYLIAFPFAALVTGTLAERAWDRRPSRCSWPCSLGSTVIFAGGLAQLSRFVPAARLLAAACCRSWPATSSSRRSRRSRSRAWKCVRAAGGK